VGPWPNGNVRMREHQHTGSTQPRSRALRAGFHPLCGLCGAFGAWCARSLSFIFLC